MYEKYDAIDGGTGSGGEYVAQTGFGWTNGLAARWAVRYDFSTLEEPRF
jgi:alpha,alpha-trehalase